MTSQTDVRIAAQQQTAEETWRLVLAHRAQFYEDFAATTVLIGAIGAATA